MKIAFVNDTFLEGRGADIVIYELARRLGRKHDIFIITTESDIHEENFKIINIRAKKLLTGNTFYDSLNYFPNLMKFKKEVSRLHKKYNFDILNVHHSALNLAFKNLPVIVTWHGSPPSSNIVRKWFNKIVLRSLKKNKFSITISHFMEEELSKVINSKKIKIIHNGVSEEFNPLYKDKGYVFFVGRMEEHKSVQELINLSKFLDYPLHIAGSGPLEKRLRNYAEKIKADKVNFLGKIPRKELVKQYQECSFFISASKWEGFGLIFLEAAACAKPSIGYRKGSIPEVIQNNKTGFLVDNYGDLKEKTKLLIKDKKLRVKMGEKALKFSKKFSWNDISKKYINFLNKTYFNK